MNLKNIIEYNNKLRELKMYTYPRTEYRAPRRELLVKSGCVVAKNESDLVILDKESGVYGNRVIFFHSCGLGDSLIKKYPQYLYYDDIPTEDYESLLSWMGMSHAIQAFELEDRVLEAKDSKFRYQSVSGVEIDGLAAKWLKFKILKYDFGKIMSLGVKDAKNFIDDVQKSMDSSSEENHSNIAKIALNRACKSMLEAVILAGVKSISEKSCAYFIENKNISRSFLFEYIMHNFVGKSEVFLRLAWDMGANDNDDYLADGLKYYMVVTKGHNKLFDDLISGRVRFDLENKGKILQFEDKYVPVVSPYDKEW